MNKECNHLAYLTFSRYAVKIAKQKKIKANARTKRNKTK